MGAGSDFSLRFWGVRGSIPTPGPDTVRYGGETCCLEITVGEQTILIDAGSGLRRLGNVFADAYGGGVVPCGDGVPSHILLTHTHLDHICGLPFFYPGFLCRDRIQVLAGHLAPGERLCDHLRRVISPPVFPVDLDALGGITTAEFRVGTPLDLDGLIVETVRLNHPGGATGYRFDYQGRRLAVITDHEHGDAEIDRDVARFVRDCDVMVYDAMYTDGEYDQRVGWGHSTIAKMLELAERSCVARPIVFHHLPERSDNALDAVAELVDRRHPGALVAREGSMIPIGVGHAVAQLAHAVRA
ncbi:MAG: MBL fold metallo-hydrolase [Pseudomonadota bacterium]